MQIPDGCSIFDELCLRIDVNQKYASVLPQWKDVADVLEVDQLRTMWIETCVRPREGLTRAMLEIYMVSYWLWTVIRKDRFEAAENHLFEMKKNVWICILLEQSWSATQCRITLWSIIIPVWRLLVSLLVKTQREPSSLWHNRLIVEIKT